MTHEARDRLPRLAPALGPRVTDLTAGDGTEAVAGKSVKVHYVGVAHSLEEFDASYNRGEPLSFRLGAGQVIAGWDQGVQGMKVGGRRKLVRRTWSTATVARVASSSRARP